MPAGNMERDETRGETAVTEVVELRGDGAFLPREPGGPLATLRRIWNLLETCHE